MKTKQNGFNLIELVIFILVIGIAAIALMTPINLALKHSIQLKEQTQASELAQNRLEIILGQYYQKGFSGVSDICKNTPAPAICVFNASETLNSSITTNGALKTIQVTASNSAGSILSSVQTLLGKYES